MKYDKFKVVLRFIPDIMCKLDMKCIVIPYYSFEHKLTSDLFRPMHLVDYMHGSKVSICDYHVIESRKIDDAFPYSHLNKLIRDETVRYPVWYGYFDSIMKFNRYFKISGIKAIMNSLKEQDNIHDEDLFESIRIFKIES